MPHDTPEQHSSVIYDKVLSFWSCFWSVTVAIVSGMPRRDFLRNHWSICLRASNISFTERDNRLSCVAVAFVISQFSDPQITLRVCTIPKNNTCAKFCWNSCVWMDASIPSSTQIKATKISAKSGKTSRGWKSNGSLRSFRWARWCPTIFHRFEAALADATSYAVKKGIEWLGCFHLPTIVGTTK